MNRSTRLIEQLVVVAPTVLLSAYLGQLGMRPIPRLVLSLGFGMALIGLVALWRRRKS